MKLNNGLFEKILLTLVFWSCSFIGIPLFIYTASGTHWLTMLIFYYIFADWLIVATLHHAHSHKHWDPPTWWFKISLYLSAALVHGTPLTWSAWHRYHHRHSDTPNDPHSPKYKSIFWIVFCTVWHRYDLRSSLDWIKNREVVWVSTHHGKISLIVSLILLWALPLEWFLTVWAVPLALSNINTTVGQAVIAHWGARDPSKTGNDTIIDTLWIFPLTFSDYQHKTHHAHSGMPSGRWVITTCIIKWLAPHRIRKLVDAQY